MSDDVVVGGLLRRPVRSSVQLAVIAAIGVGVGVPATAAGSGWAGPLIGWDVAAAAYLLWRRTMLWHLDAADTARLAVREDPNRAVADAVILVACLASLLAVGVLLAAPETWVGASELSAGLGVTSVALSWAVVHTLFTGRYARLYYTGDGGGIDFHQDAAPRYRDFAYVAFTVGMTFQVSDTDLTSPQVRATVLRHALLSYLFGTAIVAAAINLLAGLAR